MNWYETRDDRRARYHVLIDKHPALMKLAQDSPLVNAHINHGIANGWDNETILAVALTAMTEHAAELMRTLQNVAMTRPLSNFVIGEPK